MRISRWALAALVPIVALTFLMVSTPQSAEAAGPTTLGRTPWQMLRWPTLIPTPGFAGPHGATSLYGLAPAVPAVSDPAWIPAPNGSTVGFSVASRIPGCFNYADFTYFQTLVNVPTGTTLTTFTIAFSGMDDGSRVSIFNSANPGGLVIPGSYVFLGGTGTTNLAPYVVAGETNRVVITQVDDCAVGNNLISATVVLNGNTVVVTPTADLAITKVALQPTVAVGSLLTYQVTVQNLGPAPASAIVFEDNLPASVKFMSTVPGCVHDGAVTGGKVTCSGIAVNSGGSISIVITVLAMTAGPAQNNVAITDIGANLIDPNLANNVASAMVNITPPPAPPAPPFGIPGPVLAGAKVCVPLFMDQNLATQYWWARAVGGALELNFAAVGINAAEAGSATVKVFNPGGTQIASHTVAYVGTSTVSAPPMNVAAVAGDLYRVEVLVTAPPSGPVARHYLLSATGASLIGTNSPLQPQGEHEDVRWRVNVDGAGLSVQITPAPEAPLTAGSMVIIDPSGVEVATVALTPAGGAYSAPGATPGQWKIAIRGADGHYLLNKLTGADRGLYLGWDAAGSGAVLGTVTRNGLPNTLPVDVQIGGLTLPGILGSFNLPKFSVGTYPVELIGTSVTGSVTVTCDGTASIALDIPLIPTTTTVTFGAGPFVYNGTPFTATSTLTPGAAGSATITYTGDCTNAGNTCTATATFAGTPVYGASSASAVITIDKAPSTTVVSGGGTFTYDGTGHPLTAVVTGIGGLSQPVPVIGCIAAPTNVADSCTGTATYPGDDNHLGSSDSGAITINKAPSTTVVSGGGTFTYDGTGHPLTAVVTGIGGLNQPVPVTGCVAAPTNVADSCTGTATYAGDDNHLGSSDSAAITINKAPSTTVVSGGGTFTYDGTGHPLTAVVTGAGGLNQSLPVVGCVAAPTNVADSCTGTATYAGDDNHLGSSDSGAITIDKAPSTTTVSGGGTFTYDATGHPLTAVVTGAGGLNQALPVVGCVAAPTNVADSCTGTATYPGDDNHLGSTGSATATINKAPSTTTVSGGGSFTYDGTGHPLTAVVTGVGGLNQPLPVVGCIASPILPAHNCTGTATYAGDANHLGSTGSATVTITINFANPAGGVFVIGNQTPHGLLSSVTFWGAQWAKKNSLSGGSAPSAFKGFENTVAAPSCGSTWTTAPGNSAGPPASIPEYMVVVVSSNISKSGPTISGNVVQVIVVKTNAGYGPNPGHAGSGTVLQVLCTAP